MLLSLLALFAAAGAEGAATAGVAGAGVAGTFAVEARGARKPKRLRPAFGTGIPLFKRAGFDFMAVEGARMPLSGSTFSVPGLVALTFAVAARVAIALVAIQQRTQRDR